MRKLKPGKLLDGAVLTVLVLFLIGFQLFGSSPYLGMWRLIPLGFIGLYVLVRPALHRWLDRRKN